jgi:hypothetical protein
MKLQFSLATLLVCVSVLAVACMICANKPVHDVETWHRSFMATKMDLSGTQIPVSIDDTIEYTRKPTINELALRLAWVAPLSIATTLGTLLAIRRLKSRRENGPPVG